MENAVAVPEVDLSKLGRLQQALVLGALAVVYFLAGKLGLHFAFVHASASASLAADRNCAGGCAVVRPPHLAGHFRWRLSAST